MDDTMYLESINRFSPENNRHLSSNLYSYNESESSNHAIKRNHPYVSQALHFSPLLKNPRLPGIAPPSHEQLMISEPAESNEIQESEEDRRHH